MEVHESVNVVFLVMAGVISPPFVLVLLTFAALKSGKSGSDITHELIVFPVLHPMVAVPPFAVTSVGTEVVMMNG
jgi:hypothetical protein